MLEIKLGMLQDLLTNYGCRASPREAFLGLVLSGVPTPALAQYMSQNGSEPQQQNLFRQSKAIDEKCANLEALLRDQVRPLPGPPSLPPCLACSMAGRGDGLACMHARASPLA